MWCLFRWAFTVFVRHLLHPYAIVDEHHRAERNTQDEQQ